MRIPDDAFTLRGNTATLRLHDVPVLDSFVFLGPTSVPARVSFDITWTADGPVRHLRPGSDDPADPTNLAAEFRNATAVMTFSGEEDGFSFTGSGSSEGGFAEMGTERNGFFVRSAAPDLPGNSLSPTEGTGPEPVTLLAVRPNPARSSAVVSFEIESEGVVSVDVFDVAGRLVAPLVSERVFTAGTHEIGWDLRNKDGRRVPAGVYLVRSRLPGTVQTRRLTVSP